MLRVSRLSRRTLLTTAAGAALAGRTATWAQPVHERAAVPQPPGPIPVQVPFVRTNIYTLMRDCQPAITSYARGVSAMVALSRNAPRDPRGWIFQANIHGTYATPANAVWNNCQHASFFFLSWHRMYLYWFERIVRKLSNDTAFALPYWNYSAAGQAALPSPFRDTASPLFIMNRSSGVNAGAPLPASAVAFTSSMAATSFIGSPDGFGGGAIAAPDQFDSQTGTIEQQPHNVVHDAIGGLMGDPHTAAQDPIFWLHHANIDRLWTQWLGMGGGRTDPNTGNWLKQSWTFFDESGRQVAMNGRDIVNTLGELHYRYDDEPGLPPAPLPSDCNALVGEVAPGAATALAQLISKKSQPPRSSMQAMQAGSHVAETTGIALGAAQLTVTPSVALSDTAERALRAAPGQAAPEALSRPVLLILQGVRADRPPGAFYEIYLNLPPGQTPSHDGPFFVGNLSFFPAFSHHAGMPAPSETFDITAIALRQKRDGLWKEPPQVLLVLSGAPSGPTGQVAILPGANPRLAGIQITDK